MTDMTATIQVDLRLPEQIEGIGEFLENMNVVGVTVASNGKSVRCTGLVMSLVPADPVDDSDRLAEALRDLVGDHCPSHTELEPTCPTCSALILLRDREVR